MADSPRSWLATVAAAGAMLCALAMLLSLPFYSGCSGRHLQCRVEHGRIGLGYRQIEGNPESFYVAINSEGLRFLPEVTTGGGIQMQVPLWLPLLLCVFVAVGARRRDRA
ncbi:MAG: hypothetical protein IPK26_19905 [Planctomycetes bacterium]|nr:hypothetical protein [Planctomycetota bacterium]